MKRNKLVANVSVIAVGFHIIQIYTRQHHEKAEKEEDLLVMSVAEIRRCLSFGICWRARTGNSPSKHARSSSNKQQRSIKPSKLQCLICSSVRFTSRPRSSETAPTMLDSLILSWTNSLQLKTDVGMLPATTKQGLWKKWKNTNLRIDIHESWGKPVCVEASCYRAGTRL